MVLHMEVFSVSLYVLLLQSIFFEKIIYHIHGAEYHLFYSHNNKFVKKLIAIFINNADDIICLSIGWENFFKSNFNPKRLISFQIIIDYPSLSNIEKEQNFKTFLFLGMIGDRKGIFDLFQVISNNKGKYNGKLKLIIGGNGETVRLIEKIKENKLEELIEFVGWIKRNEKMNGLQKADIYILPSYNEGLPSLF